MKIQSVRVAGSQIRNGEAPAPANDSGYSRSARPTDEAGADAAPGDVLALIGAGLWAAAIAVSHILPNLDQLASAQFWTSMATAQAVFIAALPLVVVRLMGAIRRRMDEFEVASERLAASIERLSEPASWVGSNILPIRSAVSSELKALNEQLDRSLDKTVEIESRIRQEVDAIERTFADNELRLGTLVHELSLQRDTVVGATDRVRSVVKESREAMSSELLELSRQLIESGNYVRGTLEEVNVDVTAILAGVAEGMAQQVNDVVTQRIDPVVIRLDEGVRSAGELMSSGAASVKAVLEGHQDELRAALSAALERLNDVMDARSNSAMEHLKGAEDFISQGLDGAVTRLEGRLQTSSAEYLRVVAAGSTEISTKVEESWGKAGESWIARIEQINEDVSRRMAKLEEMTTQLQGGLMPALDQAGDRISAAVKLTDTLQHSAGQLQHTLSSDALGLAEKLTMELTGFQRQLVQAGQELSVRMADTLEGSLELVDDRANHLTSALQAMRDTISVSTDKFSIATAEHNQLNSQMADELSAIVENGIQELSTRLGSELAAIERGLDAGVDRYGTLLNEHSQQLASTRDASLQADRQLLVEQTSAISNAIAAATEQLKSVFADAVAKLQHEVEQDEARLESSSRRAADHIAQGARAATTDLTNSAEEIVTGVAAQMEAAKRDFSVAAAAATVPLDRVISELVNGFSTRTASFQSALDGRTRSLEDAVADATHRIEDQAGRMQRVLTQKVSSLELFLVGGNEQLEAALEQHLVQLKAIAEEADAKRAHEVERQVEVIETVLEARGQVLEAIIRTRGQEFTDRLHAASHEFEQTLADTGTKISSDIAAGSAKLVAESDDQLVKVREELRALAAGVKGSIADETTMLRRELESFAADIGRLLEGEKSGLVTAFDARVAILDKVISSGIEEVGRVAEQETDGLLERLGGGTRTLRAALDAETDKLNQGLTSNIKQMRETISEATAAVGTLLRQSNRDLESTVLRTTEASAETLAQVSAKLIKQVSQTVDQVQQNLSSSSEAVLSRLANQEKSAVRRIEQATQLVEESTRRAAEVTVDRLVALNGVVTQSIGSSGSRRGKSAKSASENQE